MKSLLFSIIGAILFVGSTPLFSYQGQNATPGFIFPIDGGRKVSPVVKPQNGKTFSVGYLTVTSTDSEGALNPAADQQSVNQLLLQVNQLYIQIFTQFSGNSQNSNSGSSSQNSSAPSSCSPRRSPRWR